MRKTTSIIVFLLFAFGAQHVRSQDITYNLNPMYGLGEELWAIPIGGELTMSTDGTRLLIASTMDSAFIVVNVETGQYRRLSQPFYRDNTFGSTRYAVDGDISILITSNSLEEGKPIYAWDISQDTLVSVATRRGFGPLGAVSKRSRRIVSDGLLLDLDSQEEIVENSLMSRYTWFDDERGVLYSSRDRRLGEFDAKSGELLREWGVLSTEVAMRRPSGSDWLYIFSIRTGPGNPYNYVEAINLLSGERLTFTEYFWGIYDEQPVYDPSGWFYSTNNGEAISCGLNAEIGKTHHNAIWKFDADKRESHVVLDVAFTFNGRETQKIQAISPSLDKLAHSWNSGIRDSSYTRMNALVPTTTSVDNYVVEPDVAPCTFTNAPAVIYNVLGEVVANVDIVNDQIVTHQLEALPQQPLWVVQGECVRRLR